MRTPGKTSAARLWVLALFAALLSTGNGCSCGGSSGSSSGGGGNPAGTIDFVVSSFSVIEYTATITIEVRRANGLAGAVTVDVMLGPATGGATVGVDYTTTPGTPIQFSWADGEIGIKSFTVTTVDDLVDDDAETIEFTLQPPTGTMGIPTIVGANPATAVIFQNFLKNPANPVIPQDIAQQTNWNGLYVGGPSIVQVGPSQFEMYYSAGSSLGNFILGRSTSTDGYTWTAHTPLTFSATGTGTFDGGFIDDPSVLIDAGGTYHMWYTGVDLGLTTFAIGYATSTDNGITWTRVQPTPVLTPTGTGWESTDVAYAQVVEDGGIYKMWYSGRENGV